MDNEIICTQCSYTSKIVCFQHTLLIDHLEQTMDTMKGEIIYEFKAVAENIHQDVAGANRDEITLLNDKMAALAHHTALTS